jgi:ribosomal protein L10
MDLYRPERERLREEYTKAWRAMRMIRATLEEHALKGSIPEQEFLADFPEEAAVLVAAMKNVLTQRAEIRPVTS